MNSFLKLFIFLFPLRLICQTTPNYGNEIPVNIVGLTFDAMEPFISPDGNTLFFNSLNDGVNTSLYYATKINDSTFNFVGPVNGANQVSPPHLDGVASLDSANNFFWVSTRNYPTILQNLMRGKYNSGNVNPISRVYGNFYINAPGWIIMDAAINYNGNDLYYCNAFFNGCANGVPCKARLGIAQKVNDSTFNKIILSDSILTNINDTNYIVYAPQLATNSLELYFTRILKNTTTTEICVATRSTQISKFSLPIVIYTNQPFIPEAPTLTTSMNILYYHKKPGSLFKIFMRYRLSGTGISETKRQPQVSAFPNPASNQLFLSLKNNETNFAEMKLFNETGEEIWNEKIKIEPEFNKINISSLSNGVYSLHIYSQNGLIYLNKLIITK